MPYTATSAPDWVKKLPVKLKDAWIKAFNGAFTEYKDDAKASKVADDVLSKTGKKNKKGEWTLKESIILKWNLNEADAPQGSFEQVREDLSNALRDSGLFPNVNGDSYVYVRFTFPDKIIVDYKGKLYQTSYTEKDGSVKFGSVEEVVEKTTLQKVKKAIAESKGKIKMSDFLGKEKQKSLADDMELIEAKDDEGFTWKVQVIKSGTSKNRNHYSPEILKEAIPLFEGARVLARSDDEHIAGKGKRTQNVVGWISEVEWDDKLKSVVGNFNIVESARWLKETIKSAWDKGKKDIIGFSIVATGKVIGKKLAEGLVNFVEKIMKVDFVDAVVSPSADGKVLGLVESELEETQMLEKLKKLIESMYPDQFEKVKDEEDVDKVLEVFTEAVKNSSRMTDEQVEKLITSLKEADDTDNDDPKDDKKDQKSLTESEAMEEVKKLKCQITLTEALSGTKLPKETVELIHDQYDNRVFEIDKLRETIKKHEGIIASFAKTHNVKGFGENALDVDKDEADKLKEALDGFFMNEKVGETEPFMSIREAYIQITGDEKITGMTRNAPGIQRFGRMTESVTTAVFDQIVQDAMHKALVKDYRQSDLNIWRQIVNIVPLSDLKTQHRIRWGGYGNLPTVNEGAPYQSLTSPTDEEATYSPSKKGGLEDLTIETIINDDVGAAKRIPIKLSRAALQTIHEFVFDFIKDNSAIYDSVALFHNDHSNLSTTAMSQNAIVAGYKAMMKQADMSNSKRLGIKPKYLLYPIDLVDTAFTALSTQKVTGTANNDEKIVSRLGLTEIMVPYWTDATNYFAVCDPMDCPTIEIGFLNGKQEPELYVQDAPQYGSMFNADKLTYKIRIWFGGGVVEYRGMYGWVVAG